MSAKEAFLYYRRRYDIEHFFRFGKDKLLLASSLTPDVNHATCWWNFVLLAYVQLYLAKESVTILPRKWERYLPIYKSATQDRKRIATPSQTQRGFGLVLDEIGTPAKDCRPRGNPKGRALGDNQVKRKRHSIVFKTKQLTDKLINQESGQSVKQSGPQKIHQFVKTVKTRLRNLNYPEEKFYELMQNAA